MRRLMLSALIEVCEIEGSVHIVKEGVYVVKGDIHVFRSLLISLSLIRDNSSNLYSNLVVYRFSLFYYLFLLNSTKLKSKT